MSNGLDAYPSRCLNAMLTLLYFVVMLTGVSLGILLVRPFVQIKLSYDRLETLGTWHMKVEDNKLVTGASFDLHFSLYNPAILPVTFNPRCVTFYYYPIGSNIECLKHNYIGDYFANTDVSSKISVLHKPVLEDSTGGLISLKDLTVNVPPKGGRFGTFKVTVPVKGFFSVDSTNEASLGELTPLYQDCMKYKRLLLAVRITDMLTRFWLITRQTPLEYEILVPLICELSDDVKNTFNGKSPKFTGSILGSSSIIVDKDVNQELKA